jgi:hypothetical protein
MTKRVATHLDQYNGGARNLYVGIIGYDDRSREEQSG